MNTKSISLLLIFISIIFYAQAQTHTSYLWHLQQPIYWPEQGSGTTYQFVKESNDIKSGGGNNYGTGTSHPTNDLQEIFSKNDRVNIYQHDAKNSVANITWHPEAGAQVNYSGCLIENVNSLANANQWGYYPDWADNYVEARSWQTTGGNTRLDIVGFTYHHALSPLISERAFRKELQAHRYIYGETFGNSPNYTKGYWPAECCFSERNIKVLTEEGFEWSVVANSHLARTLADYPLHYGTNGCNVSPPNQADKVATNGDNWWNGQIDGRGGEFAAPYCYQAHKAKYIDPETGIEYIMDVVPMADLLSYRDGYSPQGTDEIQTNIQPYEDPAHPTLVLFAHDGDNAWGGGSSYYFEAVPNFVSAANNVGIVPTTIQQFLSDHPVPADDIVHVEDGGWVNASSDWGHPQFINWLWPLYNSSTYEFNPDGWTEDARNWAVITAAENYTIMAEDLTGTLDINEIVSPTASANQAELAWHFFLPSLTSGYMYYGKAEDMEVKQTIAGNNAIMHAQIVINDNAGVDNTAPSVFIPQRFPYNPGGREFGPIYGYQEHISSKDFTVWTYAFDVSGITTAVLKYRTDNDGLNPLDNSENDTYSGGSGVSNWTSISMTERITETGNVTGDPDIDFFVLPTAIANMYYAEISGLSDTLVDYYVEVTDTEGNVFKTPIQHVYVGDEEGGTGNDNVYWQPTDPTLNDQITIYSTQAVDGSVLHWGIDDAGSWIAPIVEYHPDGTVIFDAQAVQTPFTYSAEDDIYTCVVGPFNNASQVVEQMNFVIKINESTWDNNGGQDYHIEIENNPSDNPVGSNQTVNMLINESYNFETDDFYFQGMNGATFDGIQIVTVETNGDLEYNGADVTADTDYADVTNLIFTPQADETGSPYASFTFNVKDNNGLYSEASYTFTINVTSLNPTGSDASISLMMNESHVFESSNFQFTGQAGATFAAVKITTLSDAGSLTYDGSPATTETDYSDVTLLEFTPETDEFGNPYTIFDFKVKDSEGRYSDDNYTMTINVIEQVVAGVSWFPENPTENDQITIFVSNDASMTVGGMLHWGVNKVGSTWTTPIEAYLPAGSTLMSPAVESPFAQQSSDLYFITVGPFNNPLQEVSSMHFVLHYADDSWNNNGDQDWEIPITQVVGVENIDSETNINIYPNPFYSYTIIDLSENKTTNYKIQLTDLTGKILQEDKISSPTKYVLNKNDLTKGIYLLKFIDVNNHDVITKKIVIL